MLTAKVDDPTGYGRVIRDKDTHLEKVCEHKDCNAEQLLIDETDSGLK